MKIGIDASSLTKEKVTGVENYVRSLVSEFAQIDSETEFSLYTPGDFYKFKNLPNNFKIVKSPAKRFWGQTSLPRLINIDNPDCVYLPSNIIPKSIKCPVVYHFYDLTYKYFPKAYSPLDRIRQSLALKRTKLAKHIITASQFSKDDLLKFVNFERENISVVPFGYNEDLRKYGTPRESRKGIIFIGRLEHRKNILNLLKGYSIYSKNAVNAEKLDLIGSSGFGYEEIIQSITKLKSQGLDIVIHGYLNNDKCYSMLGNARVFLYPSLYEGFGLPILEAFATKTPVITANCSSLPEVAGEAALLVNPNEPKEIADAMKKIFTNDNFANELVSKGLECLKSFSWRRCAEETLNVIKNAASK